MKEKLALVVGVVVLLAFIVLATQENGGGGFLEAGYEVLNVDDVDYKENSNMWSIILSQGRGGDILRAILTPDDGDKHQDGTELMDDESGTATKTLTINVEPQTEQCRYLVRVNPTSDKIWAYRAHYYTEYKSQSPIPNAWVPVIILNNNLIQDCIARGDSVAPRDYYMGAFLDRTSQYYIPFCLYPNVIGYSGGTERQVVFETDFWLDIGSETTSRAKVTNSNFGSAYANLGNYGNVRWLWNGDTGRYCPTLPEQNTAAGYLPFYYAGGLQEGGDDLEEGIIPNIWSTYSDDLKVLKRLDDHRDEVASRLGSDFEYIGGYGINYATNIMQGTSGQMYLMSGADSYSTWLNNHIRPRKPYIYNGRQVKEYDTSVGGLGTAASGVISVLVDPGTFIYPQFKLEIDGQKLPIERWYVDPQICDPKLDIVDVSSAVMGNIGTPLEFEATNGAGGSNECQMSAKVVCDTGYSSQVSKSLGTFSTGQSKPFTLDFSCTVEQTTSDNCKVILEGSRGESIEKSFNTLCNPNPVCTPNSDFCQGNYKVHCNENGEADLASIKYCDECVEVGDMVMCINTSREVICDDGIDNDGDGLIDGADPDCIIPILPWESWMFSLLVAVLLAMITFGGVYSYKKNPKNKILIALITSAIVLIASYLTIEAVINIFHIAVGNPLDVFTPHYRECGVFGDWMCGIDNAIAGVLWLGSLLMAGIVAFFAFTFFRRLRDFGKHTMLVVIFSIITFIIAFIIASALFWVIVVILILFVIIRYVLPMRHQTVVDADGMD